MPLITMTATIPAGQSLSNGIDLTTKAPALFILPVVWTPANMTFQLSVDGVIYGDWFDISGKEALFPVVAGTVVRAIGGISDLLAWVKIRSGSRDHPIIQTANRVITVVTI